MRYITREDLRDVAVKIFQRGILFILSKFNLNKLQRTKTAFNSLQVNSSNWWIIPSVRKRWNQLITGDENKTYEQLLSKHFQASKPFHLISIGSGVCSHELTLARLNKHWEITCIDISDKLLNKASETAKKEGLTNIQFIVGDIYQQKIESKKYHAVMFHASLHHFNHISEFIPTYITPLLHKKGHLIINEFVGENRLQYTHNQIKAINNSLKLIPRDKRKIYKTPFYKKRYYGSGIWRMKIADPSECIDSVNIMPTIHANFDTIIEKPYGGNILMSALKDISHHFIDESEENISILKNIFKKEDEYLKEYESDFVFGVYLLK